MITAEMILQEASTLPLAEQYRIALRLLESAHTLFAAPQNGRVLKDNAAEDLEALADEICGKYAYVPTSVDDFLKRKHEELEEEEARYLARHPESAKP